MHKLALQRLAIGLPFVLLAFVWLHLSLAHFDRRMSTTPPPPPPQLAIVGLQYGEDQVNVFLSDRTVLMEVIDAWNPPSGRKRIVQGLNNPEPTLALLQGGGRAIYLLHNPLEGYMMKRVADDRSEVLIVNGGGLITWPSEQRTQLREELAKWLVTSSP